MTDTITEEEPKEPEQPALPAPADKKPSFWDRPYVERYFTPLALPIIVIVGLVFYILNVSRLFLSTHGHIPVVVGSIITGVILIGAALLSGGAGRLRTPTIILMTIGFVVVVTFGGWISIGHSEEKATGPTTLPCTLKTSQPPIKLVAAPGGNLVFDPNAMNAKTGLQEFTVDFAATGHTFSFHEPTTMFEELKPAAPGPVSCVAFFPAPGTYHFYCSIPGHEAAGMHGTVTVTGPPMTLDEAVKAAGNPPLPGGGGSSG